MNYYMAPMEGLTTYIFRNAFHQYYGGIDKYFTPFLCNRHMSSREKNDILPDPDKQSRRFSFPVPGPFFLRL